VLSATKVGPFAAGCAWVLCKVHRWVESALFVSNKGAMYIGRWGAEIWKITRFARVHPGHEYMGRKLSFFDGTVPCVAWQILRVRLSRSRKKFASI
jgi:hypothetical protein